MNLWKASKFIYYFIISIFLAFPSNGAPHFITKNPYNIYPV